MFVEVSRTSDWSGDECPLDGAFEVEYAGKSEVTGNEYSGTTWLIEVESLADIVGKAETEVIINEPGDYGYGEETAYDVSYYAEIYDDYRE